MITITAGAFCRPAGAVTGLAALLFAFAPLAMSVPASTALVWTGLPGSGWRP